MQSLTKLILGFVIIFILIIVLSIKFNVSLLGSVDASYQARNQRATSQNPSIVNKYIDSL